MLAIYRWLQSVGELRVTEKGDSLLNALGAW
jgi:hypothetical protein